LYLKRKNGICISTHEKFFRWNNAIGISIVRKVRPSGKGRVQDATPPWISPATSLAHNTSVLLTSAIRCRHQVQYHLGLRRQLSFYDRLCILRALLPGLDSVWRETLTPVRAIIMTERNTPFSPGRETINAVLQFPERAHPCLRSEIIRRAGDSKSLDFIYNIYF